MTAGVLKQDPNTKRFKRTLVYFNTGTQYANMYRIMRIENMSIYKCGQYQRKFGVCVCITMCVCTHTLVDALKLFGITKVSRQMQEMEQFLSH